MSLKGHTIIQLTDMKTGKTETYEEDNLVTNFAEALFTPLGAVNTFNLSALNQTSPYLDCFGGILCLDTAIPSPSADSYYLPEGIGMTANGCADAAVTGGTITEMGTFNAAESGLSADGSSYSFVYDWNTAQGNGTIAAVCLTNPTYGYIGCGNQTSQLKHATGKSISAYSGSFTKITSSGPAAHRDGMLAWVDIANNQIGLFQDNLDTMITNKSIMVNVYEYPFHTLSPLRSISMDAYSAVNLKLVDTRTFTLTDTSIPTTSGTYNTFVVMMKDKTAIIRKGNGTTHLDYVAEIKPDGSLNEWTTGSVSGWNTLNNSADGVTYNDKYLVEFTQESDSRYASWSYVNVYDRATGTVTQYPLTPSDNYNGYCYVININGRILGCGWEIDGNGAVVRNNGYVDSNHDAIHGCAYGNEDVLIMEDYVNYSGSYTGTTLLRNSFWLSTINNLETDITKTAGQTMKITYTISETT